MNFVINISTRLCWKIAMLVILSIQVSQSQINLDVEGVAKISSLSNSEQRLLFTDSLGHINNVENGQEVTYYDANGNPRIRFKPDSAMIEFFDNNEVITTLYVLDSSSNSANRAQSRDVADPIFDAFVQQTKGSDANVILLDESTPTCRRIRFIDVFTSQTQAEFKFSEGSDDILEANVNFNFLTDGNLTGSTRFIEAGHIILNPDSPAFQQFSDILNTIGSFNSPTDFTIANYDKSGIEFIDFDGSTFNTAGIIMDPNTGDLDVSGNNVNVNTGLDVFGDFSVSGAKAFRIDHPLDPENKYLYHAAIESPVPENLYRGVGRTNKVGVVTIQLPEYFEAINSTFTYQLTTPYSFAQARVLQPISNNSFIVETSEPFTEVHWTVLAKRNDLYLQNRPFYTERQKLSHQKRPENVVTESIEDIRQRVLDNLFRMYPEARDR